MHPIKICSEQQIGPRIVGKHLSGSEMDVWGYQEGWREQWGAWGGGETPMPIKLCPKIKIKKKERKMCFTEISQNNK